MGSTAVPELPEVETMVRGLRPAVEGLVLQRLEVLDPFLLENSTADQLKTRAHGRVVRSIQRRGKWVVFACDSISSQDPHAFLVIQPRMTGGFRLGEQDPPRHARLLIGVGSPRSREPRLVWFTDTRRLGRIAWYDSAQEAERAFARSHGPDALRITLVELEHALRRTSRAIKPTLMDQKVLAGIGNIYADEILFDAGIHPGRLANVLRTSEIASIHEAISRVLNAAIAAEGSSFDASYRTVLGLEGGFLNENHLYGREGSRCHRCEATIEKLKLPGLLGRPTYWCRGCQPLKPNRRLKKKHTNHD